MKVLTAYEMRQAEQESARAGISTDMLMENAGKAIAGEVWQILGDVKKNILLLIGPGNNGGDGLVAARHLRDWGASVSLFLLEKRPQGDPNLEQVNERGVPGYGNLDELDGLLQTADAVVDALFGTGRSRQLSGIYQRVLQMVAEAKEKRPGLKIIALDLPSGLDADTGSVDPACLYADNTITLGFLKTGLYSAPGAERAGVITVVDIGIPASAAEGVKTELITDRWARSVLPPRPHGANKGSFGRVLVVAGSINYIGAAHLACSGAARVGAGLVTLATAASLLPILASRMAEITYLPLPESSPGIISADAAGIILSELKSRNVLLLGCGMGQSEQAAGLIKSILLKPESRLPPLVLDADALNILAKTTGWWQKLPGDAVLTPHPGEMGRLAGITAAEVQADRVGIARKMALEWQKTIVLKGAYTVVAAPDGRCRISPLANPGLASAGTGDVLAGAVVGLLAQGISLFDAAALAVWLHAGAGEMVKANLGDAGMLASDLLPLLPRVIKGLRES
jgi:NAD(P)H-hydrate epimerase